MQLVATDCQWIKSGDQPTDMCAHSPVILTVNGNSVSTVEDGDWCVSAAAVHLLRTLRRSHTTENPVAEHLIPCCGNTMVDAGTDSEDDVLIIGCNLGFDWQVIHTADSKLTFHVDGTTIPVSLVDWRDAVVQFADSVRKFYADSAPKSQTDDWAYEGYELMMSEWDRRRSDAESVA